MVNEPTMKEIAEWLIDCADCFDMIDSEIRDNPFGGYSRRCREFASQVEAVGEMRCGTCKYCFVIGNGLKQCDCPYVPAALYQGKVTDNFGCVRHKRKER